MLWFADIFIWQIRPRETAVPARLAPDGRSCATTSFFALARDAGTPQYVVNDAARIYRWFTQGLVDGLKDAKALLHELRGQYALFSVLNGEPRRAKVLLRVWHTSERQMPVLRRR